MEKNLQLATFGAGCFWCVEAVFKRLKGVEQVASGYMGGPGANPTYREVCSGMSGHAEVIQIKFDPSVISFEELLEVLWTTHDPTTLNRQGADKGTQYRSAIFFHNTDQQEAALKSIKETANSIWSDPIVTEVTEASEFYVAENYHQDYYDNNSYAGYCRIVISPKIAKLKQKFADKLKKDEYV